jgi:hypothetical protein
MDVGRWMREEDSSRALLSGCYFVQKNRLVGTSSPRPPPGPHLALPNRILVGGQYIRTAPHAHTRKAFLKAAHPAYFSTLCSAASKKACRVWALLRVQFCCAIWGCGQCAVPPNSVGAYSL